MLNFYNPKRSSQNSEGKAICRCNVLDFPKFGGVKFLKNVTSNTEGLKAPWFADLRYTWNTPIPHNYPSIQHSVLDSLRVRSVVQQQVEEGLFQYDCIKKHALNFYYETRAALSKIWCRFLGYAMFKVFRRLMSRLLVSPAQMDAVKRAEETGIPIVYLPLHRSHVDYQIITWVLWHWNIRLPHVASGDNLNLFGFGFLLRYTGAFFIKRRLDPNDDSNRDSLYRAVLNSYLIELLRHGMSVEFFLEGTRSRLGKTLLPKNGLISNIVQAVENGELKDVYLVPLSITYDAVVEGIFYDELMGIRKPRESIFSVVRGVFQSFLRKYICGTVCIDFGEPVLLSEELRSLVKMRESIGLSRDLNYATNFNSYRELLPWHDHSLVHRTQIRAVGHDMVFRAQQQKPIVSTALVAVLFLGKYRNSAVPFSEVARDLGVLVKEIQSLSFEVLGWCGEVTDVNGIVDNAIEFLGGALEPVIINDTVHLRIVNDMKSYVTLNYHKNTAFAPYILISFAAVVINLKRMNGDATNKEKLVERLCSTLRYEVIVGSPLEDMGASIKKALDFFIDEKNEFDSKFYARLTSPFLNTLLYVANYIAGNPDQHCQDSDSAFIRFLVGKYTSDEGLEYPEAANSDSIYNALKALRMWGAVNETRVELLSEVIIRQMITQVHYFTSYDKS